MLANLAANDLALRANPGHPRMNGSIRFSLPIALAMAS